jgi:drug/metabolite transporter (DMT)-like permease
MNTTAMMQRSIKPSISHDLEANEINITRKSADLIVPFQQKVDFTLLAIVLGWYSFAIVAIITSKLTLQVFPFPYFLCGTQFLTAYLLTSIYCIFTKTPTIQNSGQGDVIQISVSYTFGFVFTNIAFSLVNTNFAETVKSAEPVSSVLLAFFILREVASWRTYLTLIPICLGVGMSCFGDYSFNLVGFMFALLSNFCFSYRAVIAKQMYLASPKRPDEVSLFRTISLIGLTIVSPLVLFFESHSIIAFLSFSGSISLLPSILCLALVNGVAYSAYNILSFSALSRTHVITHAVLNVFRRVTIIASSVWFFSIHLTVLNVWGVGMAVGGVLLFTLAKATQSSGAAKGSDGTD